MGSGGNNLLNTKPLRSARSEQYVISFSFDTNNTDPPDGQDPADSDIVIARTDTGEYTATFNSLRKPLAMNFGIAEFLGDLPGWHVKVVSYTASTGVLVMLAYDEDDASGIQAAADSTDQKIQFFGLFTRAAQL